MWHTAEGNRILAGDEAKLFKNALASLLDHLRDNQEEGWPTGVAMFDELAYPQKVAMLCEVGSALLMAGVPMPELNALNEAAVAAVYEHLRDQIDFEIDLHTGYDVRGLIISFLRKEFEEEKIPLPRKACKKGDEWDFMVECCSGKVLWDRDFETADLFLDDSPDRAGALKEFLRIDENYYVAVPPDPTPRQLETCLERLKLLTEETR
jgi:hypothetical protein